MFHACNRVLDHVASLIIAVENGLSRLYVQKVERSGFGDLTWMGYGYVWMMDDVTRRFVDAGNDGRPALPLWIADQVRNDVLSWPAGTQRGVSRPCFVF